MDWVNLGILIATCVAAGVAVWQSIEAKGARDDAREASENAERQADAAERAAGAAEASAVAQDRASAALERQADLAERLAAPPRPFKVEPLTGGYADQRWRVTNVSGAALLDVWINTPEGRDEQWIQPDQRDVAVDVEHGESIEFTFVRRLSSPQRATVWIQYSPDRDVSLKQVELIG